MSDIRTQIIVRKAHLVDQVHNVLYPDDGKTDCAHRIPDPDKMNRGNAVLMLMGKSLLKLSDLSEAIFTFGTPFK